MDENVTLVIDISKIVNSVVDLTEIDLTNGLTEETIESITESFEKLDKVSSEVSDKATEIVKDVITKGSESLGIETEINLDEIDFKKIDFSNEADIIRTANNLSLDDPEKINEIDVNDTINKLYNSKLILPLCSSTNIKINVLTEEKQKEVENAIDNLEVNDESIDTINKLYYLFNINKKAEEANK